MWNAQRRWLPPVEKKNCTKRCVVYETWCRTCEQRDKERIEQGEEDEEEKQRMIKDLKLHKYIGESSRSFYERGLEHLRDLEELKMESHMLRHYFDCHMGESMDKMKFGGRILVPRAAVLLRSSCRLKIVFPLQGRV